MSLNDVNIYCCLSGIYNYWGYIILNKATKFNEVFTLHCLIKNIFVGTCVLLLVFIKILRTLPRWWSVRFFLALFSSKWTCFVCIACVMNVDSHPEDTVFSLNIYSFWNKDAYIVRGRSGYAGANARRRLSLDEQGPIVVHQKPGPLQTIFGLLPDEVSFMMHYSFGVLI